MNCIHLIVCQSCGHHFPEGQAKEKEVDLEEEAGVGFLHGHHKEKRAVCPECGSEDIKREFYDEEDLAEILNDGGKRK